MNPRIIIIGGQPRSGKAYNQKLLEALFLQLEREGREVAFVQPTLSEIEEPMSLSAAEKRYGCDYRKNKSKGKRRKNWE